jgi:enamine deaminase RidA (YjgF/YER057c/UK114 family)
VIERLAVPPGVYAPTWQFSQAVRVAGGSDLLFLSGIMGFRADGTMPEGVVAQAEQTFRNMAAVLRAAGGTLADVVKVTVLVGEDYLLHRDELRRVRSSFFPADFPASTLVQVAGFADPRYLVEVEAVAALPARAPLP